MIKEWKEGKNKGERTRERWERRRKREEGREGRRPAEVMVIRWEGADIRSVKGLTCVLWSKRLRLALTSSQGASF